MSKWMKLFQVALSSKIKIYFYLSRFSKQNNIAGWNIKCRTELPSTAENFGIFTRFSFQIYASPLPMSSIKHANDQKEILSDRNDAWLIPGSWEVFWSGLDQMHLTSTDMLLTAHWELFAKITMKTWEIL